MGTIKKKYKPKQENVQKLAQYLKYNKTEKKVLYIYGK